MMLPGIPLGKIIGNLPSKLTEYSVRNCDSISMSPAQTYSYKKSNLCLESRFGPGLSPEANFGRIFYILLFLQVYKSYFLGILIILGINNLGFIRVSH